MSNNPAPAHSLSQIVERRLPAPARRKFRRMLGAVDDGRARLGAAAARRKSLEEDGTRLLMRRERLDPKLDADAIADCEEEFQSIAAEMQQLTADRDRIASVANNVEQTCVAVELWLTAFENGTVGVAGPLRAVPHPPFIDTADDVEHDLKACRREITKLQGEIAQLAAAPLPAAEIKEIITEQVRGYAQNGRPRLRLEGDRVDLRFADQPLFGGNGTLSAPASSVISTIAWLFEDRIVKLLTAGIDEEVAARGGGISITEREARRTDLDAQILELERIEECLVEAALARGLECHRRRDANVLAVLGIEPEPFDADAATALLNRQEAQRAQRAAPPDEDDLGDDEASDEPAPAPEAAAGEAPAPEAA